MLANPPNAEPAMTFAHCGRYEVHLVSTTSCPYCSHMLRASDVKISRLDEVWLICSGCHKDILKIEAPL